MLEQVLKYIAGEWRVIVGAPVTVFAAILVVGFIIWWALDWRYTGIVSSYSGVIANRDAELALARTQRDDYKDKLNGATPDQAKAKIESLEARLAVLEPRLQAVEPRRLTVDQRAALIARLSPPAGTQPLITISAEVSADSPIYAQDLASVFQSAGNWKVIQASVMGPPERSSSGVALFLTDVGHPSPEASVVIAAFQAANIPFEVKKTPGPMPGVSVYMLVTTRNLK